MSAPAPLGGRRGRGGRATGNGLRGLPPARWTDLGLVVVLALDALRAAGPAVDIEHILDED